MIQLRTLILLCLLLLCPTSVLGSIKHPRFILIIMIDQFRADYLSRFESRFLPAKGKNGHIGGFRHLMTQGAYYPQGQYDLLQSVTASGHATVLTGAYPYQSGIPNNHWYDTESKKLIYCTDDPKYPVIAPHPGSSSDTGVSPKHLFATTVGDELKNAGYPSQVVSIALKDRAAVLMGGHRADLALWFDKESRSWTSSRYYLPEGKLPQWIQQLNQQSLPPVHQKLQWTLPSENGTGYSSDDSKAQANHENAGIIGGTQFPHSTQATSDGIFSMPIGIDLTITAAEKAIQHYRLGKGKYTDLLAVSFSTHDVIGHSFGLNSREIEELTVHEDKAISKLLNLIQKSIPGGLSQTVVVLTADHGASSSPEWATQHKIKAGRIDETQLASQLSQHLNEKFGKPAQGNWVATLVDFNVYLNHPAIGQKKLDQASVEAEAKAFLKQLPGVAFVVSSSDYEKRILPPGMLERQTLHTYFSGRSGDLIIVPRPYFIAGDCTGSHITGYSYDRTVPILLAGYHIKKGIFSNRAEVIDIAPTLSFLTGTVPPSLSEGRVLSESLTPEGS